MAADDTSWDLMFTPFSDSSGQVHPHSPAGYAGPGHFGGALFGTEAQGTIPHPSSPAGRYFDWSGYLGPTGNSAASFYYSPAYQATVQVPVSVAPGLAWDGFQRLIYDHANEAFQRQASLLMQRGGVTRQELDALVQGRNQLLRQVRSRLTPFGELYSEILKPSSSLKSTEAFLAQKGSIEAVLKSVGKTRQVVDRFSAVTRVAGPALIVIDLSVTAVVIAQAGPEQRGRVAAREIGGLASGTVGGLGGAWAGCATASALFSPSLVLPVVGEVTEGTVCLAGGILGGMGVGWFARKAGRHVGEALYDLTIEVGALSWTRTP